MTRLPSRPRAMPYGGDDQLGVWVAICPIYGWDHAAVYNDTIIDAVCPHCWRFWGEENWCEIRHYAERREDAIAIAVTWESAHSISAPETSE